MQVYGRSQTRDSDGLLQGEDPFTVTEQVFLCIAGIRPEMPASQVACLFIVPLHGSPIETLHDPCYPDIDRKCFVFLECKEEDTIGNLWSHTCQAHEIPACMCIIKRIDPLYPPLVPGDGLCGSAQVGCPITETAGGYIAEI